MISIPLERERERERGRSSISVSGEGPLWGYSLESSGRSLVILSANGAALRQSEAAAASHSIISLSVSQLSSSASSPAAVTDKG
ncbi:hypothetical protein QQF64_015812 [Cirrhinus molitorella]|uniref:Uncharacterized protein n=1 Tax=Cirrhinus molitorella TaxID=172907 RepID=A0ABR3LL26_9TELE